MLVVMIDIAVDGFDELDDISEHPAPKSVHGEIPKEAFHHIQPRRAGGSEVHMKSGMALQPALHFRVFMRGIVVSDQVQLLVGGRPVAASRRLAQVWTSPLAHQDRSGIARKKSFF